MTHVFIPAKNGREAERAAPAWALHFVRVVGGFMVFDSQATLETWRESQPAEEHKTRTRIYAQR
jgi:hypothetical protein